MTDQAVTEAETTGPRPPEGDWLGTPFLRFERQGTIAYCIVDRPERKNALTGAMYFGIRYAVDRVNADPDLRGLIITGAGEVFIPGGDLSGQTVDGWPGSNLLGLDGVLPFETIRMSRKPVVSAVNGLCQGGGLLIAMLSDVSVVVESATFRAPELLRGITDTGYGAYLPAQIGPVRARDMMMTGRTLTATEAEQWGLISRVVPAERLMEEAVDALKWCCRCAPEPFAQLKRLINEVYPRRDLMTMAGSLAGGESREGMKAFIERRNPDWVPEDMRTDGRL